MARELLGAEFTDFVFETHDRPEFGDSPEAVADLYLERYGPTLRALRSLTPDGAAAYRSELVEFLRDYRAADGKVRWGRDYLITVAQRR